MQIIKSAFGIFKIRKRAVQFMLAGIVAAGLIASVFILILRLKGIYIDPIYLRKTTDSLVLDKNMIWLILIFITVAIALIPFKSAFLDYLINGKSDCIFDYYAKKDLFWSSQRRLILPECGLILMYLMCIVQISKLITDTKINTNEILIDIFVSIGLLFGLCIAKFFSVVMTISSVKNQNVKKALSESRTELSKFLLYEAAMLLLCFLIAYLLPELLILISKDAYFSIGKLLKSDGGKVWEMLLSYPLIYGLGLVLYPVKTITEYLILNKKG